MTAPIPMVDLTAQTEALAEEIEAALSSVVRSGRFILGPEVEAFEREVARYVGAEHAVGLASGTDALVIGLRCLGVGPGDQVITSAFTFFATAEAIRHVGATPVFADVEPDSLCLSPASVEPLIGAHTRALLPVHLYGQPAETEALAALARARDLPLLEDSAQAIGARLHNRSAGTLGRVAAFSFFPSKNLGAFGDGGLLTTSDPEIDQRARRLRNHGQVDRYHHAELGYTARLDELQAAILRIKLRHLDRYTEQRRAIARAYTEALSGIPGIEPPVERAGAHHVYHQYTIRVLDGRRDALQKSLADSGVTSVVYYPVPLHRLDLFEHDGRELPEADRAASEVLSLPIWPELDAASVARICDSIATSMRRLR